MATDSRDDVELTTEPDGVACLEAILAGPPA